MSMEWCFASCLSAPKLPCSWRRVVKGLLAPMFVVISVTSISGCGGNGDSSTSSSGQSSRDVAKAAPEVVKFCGDCHGFPSPDSLPRNLWHGEVAQGFTFYELSGRTDLKVPLFEDVARYYEANAPVELKLPRPTQPGGPVLFRRQKISDENTMLVPGVSHLSWSPDQQSLLVTDMRSGTVAAAVFSDGNVVVKNRIFAGHPAHAELGVFDGARESRTSFIADLGSFAPDDHKLGRVLQWDLSEATSQAQIMEIKSGLGRVADISTADFDGDGSPDLCVAEFGWRKTGSSFLIWGRAGGFNDAAITRLSDRHGTSHIEVVDMNQDGMLDIVTLTSQEFETVSCWINLGDRRFREEVVFQSDDPGYGSSSIRKADIDGDGDIDILLTNGDSMDSNTIRPDHSVQWLENAQEFPFQHHMIDNLPGVYCADAADLDNDGDMDIAACTMTWGHETSRNTVVWYENTDSGFDRHALDLSIDQHAVITIGDFDRDQDFDLAVGSFEIRDAPTSEWFSIWWNDGVIDNGQK